MFCENCGTKMEGNELFCSNCGEKIQSETNLVVKQDEVKDLTTIPVNNEKKLIRKKGHIQAISIIVVIALILTSIMLINPFAKTSDQIVYLKGSSLMSTDGKMKAPKIISSNFYANEMIDDDDAARKVENFSALINMGYIESKDGKFVFYIDNINNEKYSIYKSPSNDMDKKTLIASNAIPIYSGYSLKLFELINDDKGIIYKKDGYGESYFYSDFTTEKKIIDNGEIITVDDSGKMLYKKYNEKTGEPQLSFMDIILDSENPKIIDESPLRYVLNFDEKNPLNIYYTTQNSSDRNNNTLKEYKNGVSKEILGNCEYILDNIYDGGVYATVAKPASISYGSIIIDDMMQSDNNIREPYESEYTKTVLKTDYWFGSYYDEEVDWDAYTEAFNKYEEKRIRDSVRSYIDENKYKYELYDIYYIKDGVSELVTDKFNNMQFESGNGVVFEEISYLGEEKLKMSDLCNTISSYYYDYQLEEKLDQIISKKSSRKMLFKGQIYDISQQPEQSNVLDLIDTGESNKLLLIRSNESSSCDIVELNMNKADGTVSEKPIDTDIATSRIINDGKALYYYKENPKVDNENKELKVYKDNVSNSIAQNVSEGSCVMGSNGEFYFISDYQDNHLGGNLMKFGNGQLSTIATNVMQYKVTTKGELYYLANVDTNGNGTLFKKSKTDQNAETKQLDTGVSGIRGIGSMNKVGIELCNIYEKNLNTKIL